MRRRAAWAHYIKTIIGHGGPRGGGSAPHLARPVFEQALVKERSAVLASLLVVREKPHSKVKRNSIGDRTKDAPVFSFGLVNYTSKKQPQTLADGRKSRPSDPSR